MTRLFSWKKEKDITKNPFYDERNTLVVYFKCKKCGEVFRSHLRKYYDIAVDYSGGGFSYKLDKEFIGSECQNKIHIYANFKRNFKPKNFEIVGGEFISKEDYEAAKNDS